MYKEPVGGGAGLADVSELGRQRSLNGSVDVGTLQDDEGSVATEFHRAPQNPLGGLREVMCHAMTTDSVGRVQTRTGL